MARTLDPLKFVERHGIALASARGPVPNLAEAVAGESIRGSWWSHRLAVIRQEHTSTGAHRTTSTAYPKWVPAKTRSAAAALSETDVRSQLGSWLAAPKSGAPPRRRAR